jgi:hypothetical protein
MIFDVKALLIAFLNNPSNFCEKTLRQTAIYLLGKLRYPSQALMKYTQNHCGNLPEEIIVVMTQMRFH